MKTAILWLGNAFQIHNYRGFTETPNCKIIPNYGSFRWQLIAVNKSKVPKIGGNNTTDACFHSGIRQRIKTFAQQAKLRIVHFLSLPSQQSPCQSWFWILERPYNLGFYSVT